MLVNDVMKAGETVGEFIWRVAKDRILNEAYTDQIAVALGETFAQKMPLQKFLPWKTILVWVVDRALPEYGMLALRKILEIVKLIPPGDPAFFIPGVDGPEVIAPEASEGNA